MTLSSEPTQGTLGGLSGGPVRADGNPPVCSCSLPSGAASPTSLGVQGSGGAGQGVVGVGKAPHTVPGAEQTRVAPNRRTPSPGHTAPSLKCQMQRYSFKGATRARANTHTHTHADRHKGNITSGGASRGPSPHQEEVRQMPGRSQAGGGEEGCQSLPQLCSVR